MYLYFYLKKEFEQATGIKKSLITNAVETKLKNLKETGEFTHSIYDSLVFSKTKAIFGGKVRFMSTASAPISNLTKDFIKIIACCPLVEGYGQTENTAIAFVTVA